MITMVAQTTEAVLHLTFLTVFLCYFPLPLLFLLPNTATLRSCSIAFHHARVSKWDAVLSYSQHLASFATPSGSVRTGKHSFMKVALGPKHVQHLLPAVEWQQLYTSKHSELAAKF